MTTLEAEEYVASVNRLALKERRQAAEAEADALTAALEAALSNSGQPAAITKGAVTA